ncbi:hypothetical protein ACFY2V_27380 [Streptomyces eurythermus]|uniref:hypothetical protein n=1 Tax=Streptomyces eurythermus TaxID=42237 RepID=UPI0036B15D14
MGVAAAVRGQGAGEPGVDVGLDVRPGAAGELVADCFVALAGLGVFQRAWLAQRLVLFGAGHDPLPSRTAASCSVAAVASVASSAWTTSSVSGSYTVPGAAASSWSIRSHAASSARRRSSAARSSCREACRA